MRRALVLLILAAAAVVLGGGDDARPEEFAYRADVTLPDGDAAWVHIDLPPVLHQYLREGTDDLRVFTEDGTPVPRLVLADRGVPAGRSEELSEFRRERLDDGRERVGLVLRGPEEAPRRLRLVGGAAGGGPVDVAVAVDPSSFTTLLHVAEPTADGGDLLLDLPPFVGRLLRVDAAAVERVEAEWGTARAMRRADIEARRVGRRDLPGALSLLFDLRVANASGLELELELAMLSEAEVTARDGPLPDGADWRPLHVVRDTEAPQDRVRVTIRAPDDAARRWVHVIVPCAQPEQARIVRFVARVTRHRVYLARSGLTGPLLLAAGRRSSAAPSDALARSSASWEAGAAATVTAPPWQPAIGPGLRGASRRGLPEGRPFPWAELVASLLTLILIGCWVAVRPPRSVGSS